jgi:hypothetical protein
MSEQFANRKEQIEKDFLRKLERDLKAAGCPINKEARMLIAERLRRAAMVGASEERSRTLKILGRGYGDTAPIVREITSRVVLDVLGYDED